MTTKRKPSDIRLQRQLDRIVARARARLPWRHASVTWGQVPTDSSAALGVDPLVLHPRPMCQDAWLTRVFGIRMAPTFWPDAQIFYSGDGLYWRDPLARYALAWREGRPN